MQPNRFEVWKSTGNMGFFITVEIYNEVINTDINMKLCYRLSLINFIILLNILPANAWNNCTFKKDGILEIRVHGNDNLQPKDFWYKF